MKYICIFIILFIYSGFLYAQKNQEIDSLTINYFSEDGHSFVFTIVIDKFDTTKHDISQINDYKIDGRIFYGTDGEIPKKEIKYITLIVDGEEILIDRGFYKIFYNPNIEYAYGFKTINALFGNDYQSVFVMMNASDMAGAYHVVWVFKKDGKHLYMLPTYDEVFFEFNFN